MSLKDEFDAAVRKSRELSSRPDDDTLLELYSYFKQATDGDATGDRPGAFDFKARAKFDAWKAREGMSKDVAMKGYIRIVQHLASDD